MKDSTSKGATSKYRIAVIGDVHGCYDELDEVGLKFLSPDMTIFVGDMGEEDVELVELISRLNMDKLIMLGNHDAWNSLTHQSHPP